MGDGNEKNETITESGQKKMELNTNEKEYDGEEWKSEKASLPTYNQSRQVCSGPKA